MMRKFIACKFVSVIICFCVVVSLINVGIIAYANNGKACSIKIDTVSGYAGDTVTVNLNIENNPDIKAVTVSITYDSSALVFETYDNGTVFEEHIIKAHPSRNLLRYVMAKPGKTTCDGVILTLRFKIADNAKSGMYKIDLEYGGGDFYADSGVIMPEIKAGGVNVLPSKEEEQARQDANQNSEQSTVGDFDTYDVNSNKSASSTQTYSASSNAAENSDTNAMPVCVHTNTEWKTDIEPTFKSDGHRNKICIDCREVLDEASIIKFIIGDSNRDGEVDFHDIIVIRKMLLGVFEINSERQRVSDVNGDGSICLKDLVVLKKYLISLSEE